MKTQQAPWHVLRVSTRQQSLTSSFLSSSAETFNPLYVVPSKPSSHRSADVERPLFPSYLFVRFDWNYTPVRNWVMQAPGVQGILLSEAFGPPATIDDSEIDRIRPMQISEEPRPILLVKGQKIVVVMGPFIGLEGELIKVGENKIDAILPVMGGRRKTTMLRESVRPLVLK